MTDITLDREVLTGANAAEAGASFGARRSYSPKRLALMNEALTSLIAPAFAGNRRKMLDLQEALSTSDFQNLFGDVLDREMLQTYQQLPKVWDQFATRTTVRDFRPKKFLDLLGGRALLDGVGELAEYPSRQVTDGNYVLSVGKFGARIGISWESMINDDLDELRGLPNRLADAAVSTEDYTATAILATKTGPNTGFFKTANGNAPVTGASSALSTDSLSAALTAISTRRDTDGRPILLNAAVLMVPPALEIQARQILTATQIRMTDANGKTVLMDNWLAGRVKLVVNPWLPVIDQSATAGSTWYLLPAPSTGRPAVVMGFLRGHETPDLRMKASNSTAVGGGLIAPEEGSFEVDDIQYRVRHVLGTTTLDPITTYVAKGA